jgi:predicted alpha/beta superfamily hydrolase
MESLPPFVLQATETRTLTPDYGGRDLKISVALPKSYADENAADREYPIVYLLDANFYFGTVTESTRIASLCGDLPEAMVVGLGYPTDNSVAQFENSFRQIMGARTCDYTPVTHEKWDERQRERFSLDWIVSGGAPSFLQFLKTGLIPMIESEYRADGSRRILAGHSVGGLFVLYALFHETDLFQGYVAASPSIWFGDKAILAAEEQYAQDEHDLRANLFLCVGEKEERVESAMVSDLIQFSALVEGRAYAGLTLKRQILAGLNHCESAAPGLILGLKAVLSMSEREECA